MKEIKENDTLSLETVTKLIKDEVEGSINDLDFDVDIDDDDEEDDDDDNDDDIIAKSR